MRAPYLHRAIPKLRECGCVSIVFDVNRQAQLVFQNGYNRHVPPSQIRRSNQTSVEAVNQTRNTDPNASQASAPKIRLKLSSDVLSEFGNKPRPVGLRTHGPLIQNSAIKVADAVHRLVDPNADAHNVGLFSIDLEVCRGTPPARRRHLAFVNNRSAEQTIDNN